MNASSQVCRRSSPLSVIKRASSNQRGQIVWSLLSLLVLLKILDLHQQRHVSAAVHSNSKPSDRLNLVDSARIVSVTSNSNSNSITETSSQEEYQPSNQSASPAKNEIQNDNFHKHSINLRAVKLDRNGSSPLLNPGDNEPDCGANGEPLGESYAVLAKSLARHYKLQESSGKQVASNASTASTGETAEGGLRDLPRPVNISVLIISWYPPILKLSWNLNELSDVDARKLNFYENSLNQTQTSGANSPYDSKSNSKSNSNNNNNKSSELSQQNATSAQGNKFLAGQFDLELAIEGQQHLPASTVAVNSNLVKAELESSLEGDSFEFLNSMNYEDQDKLVADLRARRRLIEESLTCFQVTYNIINSRFKVIEEYPPYFRSIMLERLLPATEYSLRVTAVYLGRYKLQSDRVQFVSPTDNESRRFKENTYRPIHRYPDERSELRIGLAQVRSEELTIVAIAIIFWIATICLFFNKWGKIRMLEPYQPAYREADAATFAHHHPSAHNLLNSVNSGSGGTTGSGALIGIGAKMSSLCGGPPGLVGVACPNGTFIGGGAGAGAGASGQQVAGATQAASSALIGAGVVAAAAEPHLVKERPVAEQHLRERGSEGALVGRSSRNLILLRGNKRYETMAADGGDSPAIAAVRPSDVKLGCLFQSKALALAKATSMWTRQQQQPGNTCQKPPFRSLVAAELLEMGRTSSTSPVRARLRQRGLSQCGGLGGGPTPAATLTAANLSPLETDTAGLAADRQAQKRKLGGQVNRGHSVTSRNQLLKYHRQSQAIDLTGSSMLLARLAGGARSLDRQTSSQSSTTNQPEDSPRQREDIWPPGRASLADSSGPPALQLDFGRPICEQHEREHSANKLRRLLFTSKTHQHHHMATSTSSTTLINNAANLITPASNNMPSVMGNIDLVAVKTSSLDNERGSSGGGVGGGRQLTDEASWGSLPSDIAGAPGPAESEGGVADVGGRDSGRMSPLAVRRLPPAASAGAGQRPPPPASLAGEHHILIEPPSPPNRCGRVGGSAAADEDLSHLAGSYSGLDEFGELDNESGGGGGGGGGDGSPRERPLGGGNKSAGPKCCLMAASQPEEEPFKEEEEELTDSVERMLLLQQQEQRRLGRRCDCRQIEIKPRWTVTNLADGSARNSQQDCHQDKMMASSQEDCLSELNNAPGETMPFQPAIRLEEAQGEASPSSVGLANDAFAKLASYQSQSGSAHQARQQSLSAYGGRQQTQLSSHSGDYLLHQSLCAQADLGNQCRQLLMQQQRHHNHQQQHHHYNHRHHHYQQQTGRIQSASCLCQTNDCCLSADETALGSLMRSAGLDSNADQQQQQQQQLNEQWQPNRPRMSSVFVASPYSRAHRDSFAMLRALSQKKSKSAEDVAYLSSLVLQIWVRDRNHLLQSVSQQQLSARRQSSGLSAERHRANRQRPKSSLTVAHI